LLSLFLLPQVATASDSALAVSPAILESVVKPEDTTTKEVWVENTTNFPLPIKGQVLPFLANEPLPVDRHTTFDASSWFVLEPADFILQPHQSLPISVSITPPKGTEPGGHYATIFFQPLIPEDVIPSYRTFGPADFELTLENTGAIHLLPQANLVITNLLNQPITTLTSTPLTILPGTTRSLSINWPRRLLFGRYQAQATVSYGSTHHPLTTPVLTLWFIPWPLILIMFAILTFIYRVFIVNGSRIRLAWKVLITGEKYVEISNKKINNNNQ